MKEYKETDFPFLFKVNRKTRFGLHWRIVEILQYGLNNGKEYKTKEELIESLKDKSEGDLIRIRNFGNKRFTVIKKWIQGEIK